MKAKMGQTCSEIQKPNPKLAAALHYTKPLMIAAIILMVLLRVIALDSDAYSHLSWSGALLTDEGFYIHNARNVVLFGHPVTDQFNNMLIMPTLHWVQIWVFSVWGVGAVQARAISVAAGLGTLVVFFLAVKRCFGQRVAAIGLVFLGLGHANLMYSRMALMDTPAALGLVTAFGAWIHGVSQSHKRGAACWTPFLISGALLVVTYATRGLSAWFVPVPFAILLHRAYLDKSGRAVWLRATAALASGFSATLVLYLWSWFLPHHAELAKMTRYYLLHQIAPHSVNDLRVTVTNALIGDFRGLAPYLFRHSPIEFALALTILAAAIASVYMAPGTEDRPTSRISVRQSIFWRPGDDQSSGLLRQMAGGFLAAWLLMAWIVLAVIGYSPDRYYVMFYPAMAALAAISVCRMNELRTRLQGTWIQPMLAGFFAYHLGEAVWHREADWLLFGFTSTAVFLYLPAISRRWAAAGWGDWADWDRWNGRGGKWACMPILLLVTWISVNSCWGADWLMHLTYVQRDADRWLTRNIPADSVLIGDVAPGLCLNSRFVAVSVIPGLCNDETPLENFVNRPRYIVILDERLLEPYWRYRYPEEIEHSHRICLFPSIVKFPVGIYRVNEAPVKAAGRPLRSSGNRLE